MAYPIKYIENNLVWNKDGECYAYYELVPYNYSFLSPEQKISNASLSLGTKIVMPHSDSQGKDSVDLIRDSLFSIQVQQPWLLLQYNSSDIESIGIDRVESLLSTSPDSNNGEDREKIVAEEIEDRSNTNLTITILIKRL